MKLSVLGQDSVFRIDGVARRILEQIGVVIPQERMLNLFSKAGPKVAINESRVRIPSELVDDCLAQAVKNLRYMDVIAPRSQPLVLVRAIIIHQPARHTG